MKKLVYLILIAMLTITLCACGKSEDSNSNKDNGQEKNQEKNQAKDEYKIEHPGWGNILEKYRMADDVKSIIIVKYYEKSDAAVILLEKSADEKKTWTEVVRCDAYVGLEGAGEASEDSTKTPFGEFGIITAFGIKDKPNTKLPYILVDENTYCCGDAEYYNQIIDVKQLNHSCGEDSEEMFAYTPQYNYGFFFDYNKECVQGKGFAFFFHCKGVKDYTGGCIAVDEKDMLTILEHLDENSKLCIYPNAEN